MKYSAEKQRYAAQTAERFVKPLYGFAIKRITDLHDAEDLAQEVSLRLYKALLVSEKIYDIDAFVWRIAHNVLANFYRGRSRSGCGICIDELPEFSSDELTPDMLLAERETERRLRGEIAYLSKIRRRIVIMYYYENKKQSEIAELLGVPQGTVKWHLFEAKNELRKGMDTMRNVKDLKFNPIRFDLMGISGSDGNESHYMMRDALSQNIAYSVYRKARTVNEIADILGVSPVFVEDAAEHMEEYGFLTKCGGGKYIANILIDEPTDELAARQDEFYSRCAKLLAEPVFDAIKSSGIIEKIYNPFEGDENFIMWSLLPVVLSFSNERLDNSVTFEEAATRRKDGAHNIFTGSVENLSVKMKYWDKMRKWCGPMWGSNDRIMVCMMNNEWTKGREIYWDCPTRNAEKLSLAEKAVNGSELSESEFTNVAEQGLLRMENGKPKLMAVHIKGNAVYDELIQIGNECRHAVMEELGEVRKEYCGYILANTPEHLRKMREYGLQYAGCSADGWLLLYSFIELLNCGKLKEVKEEQRRHICLLVYSK